MLKFLTVASLFIVLISACSPPPTPLPVDIIFTPTPTAEAGAFNPEQPAFNASLQIALDANLSESIPAADLEQLSANGEIHQLNSAITPNHADLAIAFGNLPNAAQSPQTYTVSAIVNPRLAPLDDAEIRALLSDSLHPALITEYLAIEGAIIDTAEPPSLIDLRNRYANAGYPDGFDIRVGDISTVGASALQALLARFTIGAHITPITETQALDSDTSHLILFAWSMPEQRAIWENRAGGENIINLFTLPISYFTSANIEVLNYTPLGFPIPTRRDTP